MQKLKLGILGSGFLSGIIAHAWKNAYLDDYELVGISGRNKETAEKLASEAGCSACRDTDELLSLKPDYIAEAASVAAVRENAVKILSAGVNMVVLSIGAFADSEFYEEVRKTAAEHGAKVHIASGAVGGFDVLRTISLMGNARSEICTRKGPASLKNTPLFKESLMSGSEETEVFSGNAKDAIALLPTKVNVAVAAALASTGPENTHVSINSVPGFVGDDHRITAETEGVKAVVDIYSDTSAIAGWSVVSALRNIVSPIVF